MARNRYQLEVSMPVVPSTVANGDAPDDGGWVACFRTPRIRDEAAVGFLRSGYVVRYLGQYPGSAEV